MTEEQIQGDTSSVSVWMRSCQDVLILCEEFSSELPLSVPHVLTQPIFWAPSHQVIAPRRTVRGALSQALWPFSAKQHAPAWGMCLVVKRSHLYEHRKRGFIIFMPSFANETQKVSVCWAKTTSQQTSGPVYVFRLSPLAGGNQELVNTALYYKRPEAVISVPMSINSVFPRSLL